MVFTTGPSSTHSDTNTYWVHTSLHQEVFGYIKCNLWPKKLKNMKEKLEHSQILLNNTRCFIYPRTIYWAPTIVRTKRCGMVLGTHGCSFLPERHLDMLGTHLRRTHHQDGLKAGYSHMTVHSPKSALTPLVLCFQRQKQKIFLLGKQWWCFSSPLSLSFLRHDHQSGFTLFTVWLLHRKMCL